MTENTRPASPKKRAVRGGYQGSSSGRTPQRPEGPAASFNPAVLDEAQNDMETLKWLLAEARWFAEGARVAEGVIQVSYDGEQKAYWPTDDFPWEPQSE